MQEALRFLLPDPEPVDSTDFIEQSRLAQRSSETSSRGLPLTVRGLRKSFGDNEVLRGIDLHIPAGQFVAIVGRSGCGKSTLLRLVAGLERPDAGLIDFGEAARREDVRVMFQEPRLLPWARVKSNVEVGLGRDRQSADAQARAEQGLAEVGLTDKRAQWPAALSGGQKQRVLIARALAATPGLLVLDEPTAGVDPGAAAAIMDVVARLNRELGLTVLLVTHQLRMLRPLVGTVVWVHGGRIVRGPAAEMLKPERIAEMLGEIGTGA
jgi:sulfonate transport system ATP-binding protein